MRQQIGHENRKHMTHTRQALTYKQQHKKNRLESVPRPQSSWQKVKLLHARQIDGGFEFYSSLMHHSHIWIKVFSIQHVSKWQAATFTILQPSNDVCVCVYVCARQSRSKQRQEPTTDRTRLGRTITRHGHVTSASDLVLGTVKVRCDAAGGVDRKRTKREASTIITRTTREA